MRVRYSLPRHALTLLVGASASITQAYSQVVWINEFHYDNSGSDLGEFVEVAVPQSWTDLAGTRLTLYNGGDGKPYGTSHPLSSFTQGETSGGLTFFSKVIPGLQNGAPDGLALDHQGTLQHFVSYEGSFTAQSGPASGHTSAALPGSVLESEASPAAGSLGLYGSGSTLADFTWTAYAVATPGLRNPDQVAVPEPHEYALAVSAGLALFATVRRRSRPGQTPTCLRSVHTQRS
ncbi:MAG: hypothetical protein IT580_08405 [Verrucomicrobiales bacterium]|nr:hypothetical protein [Verrucomicrobiales bacterium]